VYVSTSLFFAVLSISAIDNLLSLGMGKSAVRVCAATVKLANRNLLPLGMGKSAVRVCAATVKLAKPNLTITMI